jgi:hypothetical protein
VIAALYVETDGIYYGLPDVDPWDEARDARRYGGPWPVVAHPPCARWCRLAGFVESRFGHKRGDDGGCFEAALAAVRKWGGVLEHPADSRAFYEYGLPIPPRVGGWQSNLWDDGWTCYVEQGRYGHVVRKATWLYAVAAELPELKWGRVNDADAWGALTWARSPGEGRARVGRHSLETPLTFRNELLDLARSVASLPKSKATR